LIYVRCLINVDEVDFSFYDGTQCIVEFNGWGLNVTMDNVEEYLAENHLGHLFYAKDLEDHERFMQMGKNNFLLIFIQKWFYTQIQKLHACSFILSNTF